VDIAWKDGKLTEATIRSTRGNTARVRTPAPVEVTSAGKPVQAARPEKTVVEFDTEPTEACVITPTR